MTAQLVSVIVRCKNEEKWIGECLSAIRSQTYPNIEIILVDNGSTDKTVQKALEYGVILVNIEKFLPGLAINKGIRASSGDLIVCISAHCIPASDDWLNNLIAPLSNKEIAGVYGRQLPMNFTSALDKRDLAIVFGLDPRIQKKDGFFHNANSIFRRQDWELVPFDEATTNIEDRLWGNEMVSRGRLLCYEPSAAVYHYHGIHQGLSDSRAKSIIKIIEASEGVESQGTLSPKGHRIVALVPFKGEMSALSVFLIERTLDHLRHSKYIGRIIMGLTDAKLASHFSANDDVCVFTRDEDAEKVAGLSLAQICCGLLDRYEENSEVVDTVVIASPKNTFRQPGFIDRIVDELYIGGYDSVFPVFAETRDILGVDMHMVSEIPEKFDLPRLSKDHYVLMAVNGLGVAIWASYLREGIFKSINSAAHVVVSSISSVEVEAPLFNLKMAEGLVSWFEESVND